MQRAYRGRHPSAPMDASTVVAVIDLLERQGIDVWLDGGWGVDALLESQDREHDDLDVVAELRHSMLIIETLKAAGYEVVDGAPPKSFVMVDADGRQVDVHPVVFDKERGGGVYVMRNNQEWVYPSEGFSGRGLVAGRPVRCLSPAVQVLVHAGYELGEKDRELFLLHKRFGVELPPEVRERALTFAGRAQPRSGEGPR
ncbi:MAG: nucleotidyltransferase domain-containing protein [Gaiellaceae bacterium]